VLPTLQKTIPKAEVVSRESIANFQGGAILVLVRLPECSSVSSGDGKEAVGLFSSFKRLDDIRAMIVFLKKPYLFVVQASDPPDFTKLRPGKTMKDLIESEEFRSALKKRTVDFAESIQTR
jgi:hypothetical protein